MKHDNRNQNPWAGLSSYEDPAKSEQKLKFCGRDNETKEVARLIDDNFFVTLYGKSGIGKTSLLNAGVFPSLRREQYTPLSLRLGMTEETISFQDVITQAIERVIFEIGCSVHVINVIDEQREHDATDYLWRWFARRRFLTANGQITFPVLVFDQFEEVFRHKESRKKTKVLLEQLNYLIDESHAIGDCFVDREEYNYDFNFRFVLSIREDDLYRLEDILDNCSLPALKHCRYRLRSLSEQGARDAILIPGEGLFREDGKEQIAQTVIGIARNKEDNSISTNLLSLVCNRLYVESQNAGSSIISLSLVDTFVKGNPFERFYNEATRGFSNKEKSYIEEHLVDSTGRRNSIPESDFLVHVKNGLKLIEGKNRILQRVSTSSDGGNSRIELIHDSFCEPLATLKEKRERRRRLRWLAIASAIILLFGVITAYIANMSIRNLQLEGANAELNDSLKIALTQVEQERDAARFANLQKDSTLSLLWQSIAQLDSSYKQLSERKQQLEEAIYNMGINQSRVLAEKASALVDEGDSYLARLIALEALPPKRPYTIEAEAALRKAFQCENAILRGHIGVVNSISFSPDGKLIASASHDRTIRVWDAETGLQIGQPLSGHTGIVRSVSFSPNGKYIVSASNDLSIRIWDVLSGHQICLPLTGHTNFVTSASFSPDGKLIVSSSRDKTIRIWDIETGQQIGKPFEGHTDIINSATFSPDGTLIASASSDNTIRIWDVRTGEQICDSLKEQSPVESAVFSPDGKCIISASGYYHTYVRIWDVQTGKPIGNPLEGHVGAINSIAYNHDGTLIVSASEDETIRIWNAQTGKQIGEPLIGHIDDVTSVAFSPNNQRIISASRDQTIRIWDIQAGWQFWNPLVGHTSDVETAAFSSDGKFIVSASYDKNICIWDAQTGERIGNPLQGHTQGVRSASFSPNGQHIVSASYDNTIRIWDVQTGLCQKIMKGHKGKVYSASYSSDGLRIVSASEDKTIRIWDARTGKQIGEPLIGHKYEVNSAVYSPDGLRIVSASNDNTIRIWDAQTGRQIGEPLIGHTNSVESATFSPDGKLILSASYDKTIRIWDAQSGKLIGKPLVGHSDWVLSAAFSPNGKRIVSVSKDKTIRVWDAQTGIPIGIPLKGHGSWIYSAVFSPDGKRIVSASRDCTIRIWEFPPLQELIYNTRARFKDRPLTPEERRKYYLE